MQLNEDEAGPYQAIPQPGASWQPEGHPALQPHEYERGGTAKLLTLFRPATGEIRAKGVVSVTNAVLHPWLTEQLAAVLAEIEQQHPAETLPAEEQRPPAAQWRTWLWPHESAAGLPPLRIILVLDNLAGHLSPDLLGWFFHHGVMPLYTPVGGSWLNMAESVQRIIVPRADERASIPPVPRTSLTGWSKRFLVGTKNPRRLCGMASGGDGANAHGYVAWLGPALPWSEGIQLPVDPLAVSRLFPWFAISIEFERAPECGQKATHHEIAVKQFLHIVIVGRTRQFSDRRNGCPQVWGRYLGINARK